MRRRAPPARCTGPIRNPVCWCSGGVLPLPPLSGQICSIAYPPSPPPHTHTHSARAHRCTASGARRLERLHSALDEASKPEHYYQVADCLCSTRAAALLDVDPRKSICPVMKPTELRTWLVRLHRAVQRVVRCLVRLGCSEADRHYYVDVGAKRAGSRVRTRPPTAYPQPMPACRRYLGFVGVLACVYTPSDAVRGIHSGSRTGLRRSFLLVGGSRCRGGWLGSFSLHWLVVVVVAGLAQIPVFALAAGVCRARNPAAAQVSPMAPRRVLIRRVR